MIKPLLHPFSIFSEKKLLFFGIVLTIFSAFLASFFNARRNGVLDVHFVTSISFTTALIESLINLFILSIFLFIAGIITNKKTRLIDIFITALVALPVFLLTFFFNINNTMSDLGLQISELNSNNSIMEILLDNIFLLLVFALWSLLVLAWVFILLYSGFKVASNAKGSKPIFFIYWCNTSS
ncbi:MAG: hypothetical protein CVU03_04175 [Bacteroidetes bacterium HGW-Bacteroidetes-2]|jgi:hypothetical protein|nr:MAG: hypothetical protein CVU03_04175 [Bacteroidetes bacterium HGW-Bacteroidetes-2]